MSYRIENLTEPFGDDACRICGGDLIWSDAVMGWVCEDCGKFHDRDDDDGDADAD